MRRPFGTLLCVLVVVAAFVGAAQGGTDRTANCGGACIYTQGVLSSHRLVSGGWSFDGQFNFRQNARKYLQSAKPWLSLSNTVTWKLALGQQFTGNQATAEIHLGTPSHPGRLLAVLCAHCGFHSHGRFRLSDETLAAIFAGTKYLGGGLLVNAYAVLRTSTQTLRQQLRDA